MVVATPAGQVMWKEYTFPSGTSYRGGFLETKKEGRGYWKHPEGESYEGEYHANKQHGWGVYEFPDTGKKYYGQWEDGAMHGEGVYVFNKEASEYFVGTYKSDRKHGVGVYRYSLDCRVTQQVWDNGVLISEVEASPVTQVTFHGKKVSIEAAVEAVSRNLVQQPTTDRIDLEFTKRIETRSYTFPSGAKYSGAFLGTKKHGFGLWEHPSGDLYEGTFRYNKHEGWGMYKIGKSGKHYVGSWKNGKMDGWGCYYFNEQKTEYFIGTYVGDAKEGTGVYVFASGNVKVLLHAVVCVCPLPRHAQSLQFQKWEKGTLLDEVDAPANIAEEYEEVKRTVAANVAQGGAQKDGQ